MTVNHHPKVAVHAVKSSSDALASQGARRATEEASASVPPQAACATDAEVVAHARRRQFSNAESAEKRRILDAAPLHPPRRSWCADAPRGRLLFRCQ
jgi:hypothetical protein